MTVGLKFGGTPDLREDIRFGIMVAMHLRPPRQSFTMARVPAVRTKVFLLGIPDLTPTHSQRVEMGNQLVSVQVSCALHFMLQGIFFGGKS